jgi:hypothetical protein
MQMKNAEIAAMCAFVARRVGSVAAMACVATVIYSLCPRLARQLERAESTRYLLGWARYECVLCEAARCFAGVATAAAMARRWPGMLAQYGGSVVAAVEAVGLPVFPVRPVPLFTPHSPLAVPLPSVAWGAHRVVTGRIVVAVGCIGSHVAGTALRSPVADLAVWLRDGVLAFAAMRAAIHFGGRQCMRPEIQVLFADVLQAGLLAGVETLLARSHANRQPPAAFELTEAQYDEFEAMSPEELAQLQEIAAIVTQAQRVRHSAKGSALTMLASISAFRNGKALRLPPELEATVANPMAYAEAPGVHEQTNCPICLEEFSPESLVIALRCRHAFHAVCIRDWLLSHHHDCPFCRADARDTDVMRRKAVERSAAPRSSLAKQHLAQWAAATLPEYVEHGKWTRAAQYLLSRGRIQPAAAAQLLHHVRVWPMRLVDVALIQLFIVCGLVPPRFFARFPDGR